ncbi:MAG: DUF1453 family protein [Candidatus Eremiobacteraeota bacterium]|nr:DUF1453 family protein [Candidatus Eremiobacteraeota bacterium]
MTQQQIVTLVTFALIIVLIGVRIVRMSREQRFRPSTMWVLPAIFALITAGVIAIDGLTSPLDIAIMLVALAVGLGIGLYQGTHTTVRVDHTTHAMYVKISPWGSLIWVAVLALRVGVRYFAGGFAPASGTDPQAAAIAAAHSPAGLISTALLVLAVGVIFGLRVHLQRVYDRERATL